MMIIFPPAGCVFYPSRPIRPKTQSIVLSSGTFLSDPTGSFVLFLYVGGEGGAGIEDRGFSNRLVQVYRIIYYSTTV